MDIKKNVKRKLIQNHSGVTVLSAVIILPIMITVMMVLFDLSRIFLTIIYAKEVVLTTAKLAVSSFPESSIPDMYDIIKSVPGESVVNERKRFWTDQLDPAAPTYHGLTYFTEKELKVFNLGYGFMIDINPDIPFLGLSLFSPLTGTDYYTVTQSASAHNSGDIAP